MADSLATGPRQVKVYVLDDDEKWDDRGTGHVRCEHDLHTNCYMLKVVSEETGRVVLCSQVRSLQEAYYQLQEDTIISWTEDAFPSPTATVRTEVALSFAEAEGCREIWDKICQIDDLNKRHQSSQSKQLHGANAPNSSQQNQNDPSSDAQPDTTLPLSISMVGQGGTTTTATDLLVSTGDAVMPSVSSADSTLQRTHQHVNSGSHIALVDPGTAADIAHSTRFFDDTLDGPNPWSTDALEDVIFRENPNMLFLTSSPGALVPPSASDASVATGFTMPDPTRAGVEILSRVLADQSVILIPAIRERVVSELSTRDYVPKLCQVFRTCERLSDLDGLAMLYHAARGMFLLGNCAVLEVLVHEKNLMDVVGCLEYDPEHIAEMERKQEEAKRRNAERSSVQNDSSERANEIVTSGVSSDESPHVTQSSSDVGDCKDKSSGRTTKGMSAKGRQGGGAKSSDGHFRHKPDANEAKHCHEKNATVRNVINPDARQRKGCEGLRSAQECDQMDKTEGKGKVQTEVKEKEHLHCAQQKNLSEETTSSGNLVGEDGERRFVVRIHRDFLERTVSYRSVVPITDKKVMAKIHQNYRVSYIRDVILSRSYDETLNNGLSNKIVCNNVDILMYFIQESGPLQEVFDRLRAAVQKRQRFREQTVIESSCSKGSRSVDRGEDIDAQSGDGDNPNVTEHADSQKQDDVNSGPVTNLEIARENRSSLDTTRRINESQKTGSTGESNVTALGDPSTSKEVSSHCDLTCKKRECATGPRVSTEENDEFGRGLRGILSFLRELCTVVKSQQPILKNRFHSLLIELGLLEISADLLLDTDLQLQSLCCDILAAVIYHDQTEVRSYLLKNVSKGHVAQVRRVGVALRSIARHVQGESPGFKRLMISEQVGYGQGEARRSEQQKSTNASDKSCSRLEGVDNRNNINSSNRACNGDEKKKSTAITTEVIGVSVRSSSQDSPQAPRRKAADSGACAVEAVTATVHRNKSEIASSVLKSAESIKRPEPTEHELGEGGHEASKNKKPDNYCSNVAATVPKQSKFSGSFPLVESMVKLACDERESGVVLTVLELLKVLLDPMNMRMQTDKETFLDLFYEKFIAQLLAPIVRYAEREEVLQEKGEPCEPDKHVSHLCDLLSFCISSHSFRGKYFVLGFDVGGKISKLLNHRKAYMRLAALRFLRSCIGVCDDGYDRYILKERLLDPVMEMCRRNGCKDNLITSAILDIVSFVSTSKRFKLLSFLMKDHYKTLEPSSKFCGAVPNAKKTLEELVSSIESNRDKRHSGTQGDVEMRDVETSRKSNTLDEQRIRFERGSGAPAKLFPQLLGEEFRTSSDTGPHQKYGIPNVEDHVMDDLQNLINLGSPEDRIDEAYTAVVKPISTHGYTPESHILEQSRVVAPSGGKQQQLQESVDQAPFSQTADRACTAGGVGSGGKNKALSCGEKRKDQKHPDGEQGSKLGDVGLSLVGYEGEDSDNDDESNERSGSGAGRDSTNGAKNPKVTRTVSKSLDPDLQRGGFRLSLSRQTVRSGEMPAHDGSEGEVFSETSEDSTRAPRKRERTKQGSNRRGVLPGGGIETCTRAVMEDQTDGSKGAELDSDEMGSKQDGRLENSREETSGTNSRGKRSPKRMRGEGADDVPNAKKDDVSPPKRRRTEVESRSVSKRDASKIG